MSTPVFPFEIWPEGILQARFAANDNALRNEVLSRSAKSFANIAPGSPAENDVHIVGTTWGGFSTGDVVIYKGGTWIGFAPFAGWIKFCLADDKIYRYLTSWAAYSAVSGAPAVTESGTSHNITAAEVGCYIRFTSSSAKTCTFRPNSTEALPVDGEWHIRNVGASNLTLTPGSGVTLTAPYGGTLIVPPAGTATVKRVASDNFDVFGVTV